jgi:hypothetical protein
MVLLPEKRMSMNALVDIAEMICCPVTAVTLAADGC